MEANQLVGEQEQGRKKKPRLQCSRKDDDLSKEETHYFGVSREKT